MQRMKGEILELNRVEIDVDKLIRGSSTVKLIFEGGISHG